MLNKWTSRDHDSVRYLTVELKLKYEIKINYSTVERYLKKEFKFAYKSMKTFGLSKEKKNCKN